MFVVISYNKFKSMQVLQRRDQEWYVRGWGIYAAYPCFIHTLVVRCIIRVTCMHAHGVYAMVGHYDVYILQSSSMWYTGFSYLCIPLSWYVPIRQSNTYQKSADIEHVVVLLIPYSYCQKEMLMELELVCKDQQGWMPTHLQQSVGRY